MWPNPQETPDLLKFTEKILNGKLHFLCSGNSALVQKDTSYSHTTTLFFFSLERRKIYYCENVEYAYNFYEADFCVNI